MIISIIIPIYNTKLHIKKCINSIIHQTFTNYEVILIDDASPDNSLQIAEKILTNNKITFQSIIHHQNKGQSIARNNGIKVAKGKYIMFVDSDDFLANKEVLNIFYKAIISENYDFVEANYNHFYNDNIIKKQTYIKGFFKNTILQSNSILEALLYTKLSVSSWNKLIDKEFLLQNNLFFPEGVIYEDELWAFKMCNVAKKCYYMAEYCYNHNVTNTKSTTKNISVKNIKDMFFVIKEQLKIITENNNCTPTNANAFIFSFRRLSFQLIKNLIALKDKKQLMYYYIKLEKVYNNSSLRLYKKCFFLPTKTIMYLFTKRLNSNNPIKFYKDFTYIDFIIAYAIIGRKGLFQKLTQQIR